VLCIIEYCVCIL